MKQLYTILLLLFAVHLQAQSTLDLKEIMKGENFTGYSPSRIQWGIESDKIYFSWNPDKELVRSTYHTTIANGNITKTSDEEMVNRPQIGVKSNDGKLMVYQKSGDLFLYDFSTKQAKTITNTLARESNPQFSADDKTVFFRTEDNLFAWNSETGSTEQLTDFRKGKKAKESKNNEQEQWLTEDQLDMFEVLSERKQTNEINKERGKKLQPTRPLPIYLEGKSLFNLSVSPNGAYITFNLVKRPPSSSTIIHNYVTESGYAKNINARSKVGSPQSVYEFGIYDVAKKEVKFVDTKQIEGIYDKPEFLKEYIEEPFDDQYKDPREVVIHGPVYSKDSKMLVVVRSQDNKDRWIMLLDPSNAKLSLLDRQRDEAWIGGPGISGWNFSTGNVGWLADNSTIWFQSEETGFSHLYTLNTENGKKKALTKGKFEIRDAQLSEDKNTFYIQSNKESPHIIHFYHLPVSGGKLEQITTGEGNFRVTISPDEKQLAIMHSTSNTPWELYVMENKAGAEMKKLTTSTTEQFRAYNWKKPEIIQFKARDGKKVAARIYKPAKSNGAAVVFVHGAGYLQNVHTWWSSYYREYMFHNLLIDKGYTVLDIDYRGSDGYGRDWRTGIYRHMGGKDLSDNIDGAAYLVNEHGIDAGRIGIYGGSYGGFITIMAMLTSPETFKAGAGLRSVTDWAHYNHGYTSNILNTPAEDSKAFKQSSPIYFAEGLKGRLLMLHGVIDDNVQFQDVVRLSQRFIELGKTNWDVAIFPMERHGFQEASSWYDEYRRILEEMEKL